MAAERSSSTSAGAVARRAPNPRSGIAAGPVVKDPIQAREIARDWVISAGFSPTEGRITALLPVARVWSPKARKVAIGLVAAGQLPTRAAVESVTHKLIEEKKQAIAQLPPGRKRSCPLVDLRLPRGYGRSTRRTVTARCGASSVELCS